MIGFAPTGSAEIARDAVPFARAACPIAFEPSLNVIVPVAALGVTVAVKVTA